VGTASPRGLHGGHLGATRQLRLVEVARRRAERVKTTCCERRLFTSIAVNKRAERVSGTSAGRQGERRRVRREQLV